MSNVTKRTPEKEEVILDALRQHPSWSKAARKARIARITLWHWRTDDPAFAARCEQAREQGIDGIEDALSERAIAGDTTAAIFILKTWRRDKYGDKLAVNLDVRTAAERVAADLDVPIAVVLAETYRMLQDGS